MPHLDLNLYLMVLRGELPPRALVDVGFRHLLEVCGICREEWETYSRMPNRLKRQEASPAEPDSAVASAYGPSAERLDERRKMVAESRRRARRDFRELMKTPADQRQARVVQARARFRSRGLAELLLEESRRVLRSDAREAAELAALASTVLLWTPRALEASWGQALHARALAHGANALRVAGDLEEAAAGFSATRRFLAQHPLNDIEAHAEIARLEASIRLDQRRFEEAEALLNRAALLANQGGLSEELARSLVKRAVLHRQQGRFDETLEDLERALSSIDPKSDMPLFLSAVGTLALTLCDLEKYAEARQVLDDTEQWWDEVDEPWWTLRLRTLEGRIAFGLSDLERAEILFTGVLDSYRERGMVYDGAVAALDVALVHLAQGRTSEVKRLAAESAPILRSGSIHREALAALALFEEAAREERLSAATAQGIRRYLEQARHRPDLVFQRP
ncbi:MAG TPA: tetratricopeptide repeat protein [Thermoanaerobaculia bacterium]|nr:tetratricopeptide repeat protein [Thermoanaerobaculia bacterium]